MSVPEINPYASPSIPSEPAGGEAWSGEPPLATLWQRLAGALIDTVIVLPIALAIGFAMTAGLDAISSMNETALQVLDFVGGLILGGAIFLALHGYLLAYRGQTIGKYLVNTQIVDDDGKRMPLWPLFLKRYVPWMAISAVPFIGPIVGLANILGIFRASRKCLHDEFAGTKVIQLRPDRSPTLWLS